MDPSQLDEKKRELIPAMYLKILEHAVAKIKARFSDIVSCYMENYEAQQDKEAYIKSMFIELFDTNSVLPGEVSEPYVKTIGEN